MANEKCMRCNGDKRGANSLIGFIYPCPKCGSIPLSDKQEEKKYIDYAKKHPELQEEKAIITKSNGSYCSDSFTEPEGACPYLDESNYHMRGFSCKKYKIPLGSSESDGKEHAIRCNECIKPEPALASRPSKDDKLKKVLIKMITEDYGLTAQASLREIDDIHKKRKDIIDNAIAEVKRVMEGK